LLKESEENFVILGDFALESGDSKSNYFDHNNKKKLNTIYQELIKNIK